MSAWALAAYMLVMSAVGVATLHLCAAHGRDPLLPLFAVAALMIAPWCVFDVFIDPPRAAVAAHPHLPIVNGLTMLLVGLAFGIVYTRRTRSPLFAWSVLAGIALYPFVVEPLADYFVAVWYPTNLDIAATVFGRPMPWLVVLFYGGGIPLVMVIAYELAKRRSPGRLLLLIAVVSVAEVPLEMLGAHFHWMNYYGNHALILGVPVYCVVQNGGFVAVTLWSLAHVVPRVHGWRWAFVPLVEAATLPAYAIATTWPAYLAIHFEAAPLVGWLAAILATVLNGVVVAACVRSPALARLRERRTADVTRSPVPVLSPTRA